MHPDKCCDIVNKCNRNLIDGVSCMAGHVSDAVIRRLPGYYRHLRELEEEGVVQISSQELGQRMRLTASQIRQDINCFGGFGRQGYGYPVRELKEKLGEILGINRKHRMIIIGAGKIGQAVANYPSFSREGFETVAMFDIAPEKHTDIAARIPVFDITDLEKKVADLNVSIAVLALPASSAQEVLERLYACGVKAIWNFAPLDLKHPADMELVNVHLSDTLHILSYKMAQHTDKGE